MKQSTIKEILNVSWWDSKYGKMYKIGLLLENWETIYLNKKKENAFKVWDKINYEEIETWNWKKWKEIIEKKQDNNQWNQRWYFTSIAFQIAFDKLYTWEDDYQKTVYLAKRIFADMLDNYEWKEN